MYLSKQEFYSIIGAVAVIVLGWIVQLFGLPWEVIVLALGVLGWGFMPRIRCSIRSWQASKTVRAFQPFLGGNELLGELERVEAGCGRLVQSLPASGQDVNRLIMELDHLWLSLSELKGKYRGVWTLSLQSRVTMVVDQLREASSALGERDLEHTKAHIDGAVQNTRALVAYLKSPPTS